VASRACGVHRFVQRSAREPSGARRESVPIPCGGLQGELRVTKLAATTREGWSPWLDRIAEYFGDLRVAQFDRPDKIRPIIRQWRGRWADKPRTADYGIQVLSRVLSVDPLGKIAGNPCDGIKQLYSVDRSEIIWTDADIAALKRVCTPEVARAVDLASCTGLRLGDLVRLSWSHVGEDVITLATGKSRGRKVALVSLYGALRTVLDGIPKRSTTVLTNKWGRAWSINGLNSAFNRAKHAAGVVHRGLQFHDLRGTAATMFYTAGLSERVIAEIMGWEKTHVAKIIRRYVDRAALTKQLVRQLDRAKKRTESAKPTAKTVRNW
jgi:integrase